MAAVSFRGRLFLAIQQTDDRILVVSAVADANGVLSNFSFEKRFSTSQYEKGGAPDIETDGQVLRVVWKNKYQMAVSAMMDWFGNWEPVDQTYIFTQQDPSIVYNPDLDKAHLSTSWNGAISIRTTNGTFRNSQSSFLVDPQYPIGNWNAGSRATLGWLPEAGSPAGVLYMTYISGATGLARMVRFNSSGLPVNGQLGDPWTTPPGPIDLASYVGDKHIHGLYGSGINNNNTPTDSSDDYVDNLYYLPFADGQVDVETTDVNDWHVINDGICGPFQGVDSQRTCNKNLTSTQYQEMNCSSD